MKTTPKAAGLKKKGFTLIELVVALAVSTILGVVLVSTVQTGVTSYKNIDKDMMSETQARAALSLVTVQIRQHDMTGAISVSEDNRSITFLDDPSNETSTYTVVSFEVDKLYAREYTGDGMLSAQTEVALLTNFTVAQQTNAFNQPVFLIHMEYGEGRVLDQTVTQRSAGVATPSPVPIP